MPGLAATQSMASSALLRRSFRRTFPPAVRGQGAYLWDAQGKQYLDFSGSAAVNFIGHGVAAIVSAMTDQARSLEFVHGSQFTTPIAEQYATELLEFAGQNFRGGAAYFTCGGTEAIDTALKLARQYQVEIGNFRRSEIISRNQSYHGATLGAMAISRHQRPREIYGPMVREFTSVPYPYRCVYECADSCQSCGQRYAGEIETAISAAERKVAAVILEPVSGMTLGAVVPPPGYLEKVGEICRREEVLLVADEVMTGVGRTGKNFAIDHWGLSPDILVTARGLASGYAPLGAVILSRKVVEAIAFGSGSFLHGFAYSSHPISLAAGQATLKHVIQTRLVDEADSDRATSVASNLKRALQELRRLRTVGDVRGIGLLWAAEFVSDPALKTPFPSALNFSGRVAQAALERGLLVYPMQGCVDGDLGDHLLISPPAVVSPQQIAWAAEQLGSAIQEVSAQL